MFGNMADMFGKVNQMRQMMEDTRKRLDDIVVSGSAGDGQVKVEATANKRVLKIEIAPALFEDTEMLEDLIVAAVNKALDQAAEVSQSELSKVSGQLLPGFDPSQLGF